MKFALIHDNMAISSYYINNDTAYAFKCNTFNGHTAESDKPYVFHHAVSPQCYIAMQNLPFLFDEGYYLNWAEWDELPDLDLDLIFFGNEKNWNPDGSIRRSEVTTNNLKKKYPNAIILNWIKELSNGNQIQNMNRIEELKYGDGIITSGLSKEFQNLDIFNYIRDVIDKKLYFIPQPVNTEYLFDNFYSNKKEECLYAYIPNPYERRGNTYDFVNYLSKKYKIPVKYKPLDEGQKFDYLSQKEFIDLWSSCSFHFNLDPLKQQPGNQIMQVACTGTINIGGENESHHILYPETATCDERILEQKFVEYLEDYNKRFQSIQYAWIKVNEVYGFKTIKQHINNIIGDINK